MTAKPAANSNRDPFEILDISPDASPEEIQEAYLLLVATYGESSFATYTILSKEQRMAVLREIETAYQTLKKLKRSSPKPVGQPTVAAGPQPSSGQLLPEAAAPRTGFWERLSPALAWLWPQKEAACHGRDTSSRQNRALARNYRLSAGQHLRNVRTLKGLTLESVSESTNIRVSYLRALEEGLYDELPAGVYRRLMLTAYAKSLDLSPESLLKDLP